MNVKLLLTAVVLAAGCAGSFAGSGAARATAVASQPELDTWSSHPGLGAKSTTGVAVRIPATAAEAGKLTLYLPAGYGLNPSVVPGTREGMVLMVTASDLAFGHLQAVDPTAYVNTAQAQACAPGAHTAVWIMNFQDGLFSSQTVKIPIYIDATTGDEAALGAYKLQTCLPLARISSPGGWPLGSRLHGLVLLLTHVANPVSASNYVWRAFVSNPDVNGNPDPSTTYELRSDMPLPAKLTLSKRAAGKHRAVLSGRLTTPSAPVAGVSVTLYREGAFKPVASTRTTADGSYRFSRPIARNGTYQAEVGGIGACTDTSTAPMGCLDETRAAVDSPRVRVVVRSRR